VVGSRYRREEVLMKAEDWNIGLKGRNLYVAYPELSEVASDIEKIDMEMGSDVDRVSDK